LLQGGESAASETIFAEVVIGTPRVVLRLRRLRDADSSRERRQVPKASRPNSRSPAPNEV
jgi:hypothetical protein